ncbi:hypothetical protein MMC30_004721 [Trapelia coarctata]|nr:hypothetical protein [Trapelia coarctata]
MSTPAARAMIATNAVFLGVSSISVILRLYARRTIGQRLRLNDYLIFGAWFFAAALAITNIAGVPIGSFGLPIISLTDEQVINYFKFIFILQFWYIIAVALAKLSILCFYGPVFSLGRFPIPITIFIALVTSWLISFLFATFFQVWPLSCNWVDCEPTPNYLVMYMLLSITDIILNISILCLPVFYIRKLQMSQDRKLGLGAIFGFGVFCIIASTARLVYAIAYVQAENASDYTSTYDTAITNTTIWSAIEACASVICANLPCYAPFLSSSHSLLSNTHSHSRSPSQKPTFVSSIRSLGYRSRETKHKTTSSTENIITGRSAVETNIEAAGSGYLLDRNIQMGKVVVHTRVDTESQTVKDFAA